MPPLLPPDTLATVTFAGNVIKVTASSHRNSSQTIERLEGGDEYIVMSTGEVKEVQHSEKRADNTQSLRQTFARLRLLINANTDQPEKIRFITLTYAKNMQDPEQLYSDFDKFMKRLRYWCQKHGYERPEYIAVAEPQKRGAWHLHLLVIFSQEAPFIPNTTLKKLWGLGFTHIRAVTDIDDLGSYLSAYLGDIELPEDDPDYTELATNILPVKEHTVNGVSKKFIKGGRLHLYPRNMRIYRCSRGVKRPTVKVMKLSTAERLTQDMVMTYETAVRLSDPEAGFENNVHTRYYNKKRLGRTSRGENTLLGHIVSVEDQPPKYTPPQEPRFTIGQEPKQIISDKEFEQLLSE